MSDRQQIVVTVGPDGAVRAQTRGILGEKCLDYVAVLEDLIDGRTTASGYTADWTRQELHQQQENPDIDLA